MILSFFNTHIFYNSYLCKSIIKGRHGMRFKKSHIVLIVLLAVAVGIIISTLSDVSSYATFRQAAANPEQQFHIIGNLNTEKPIELSMLSQERYFSFYMTDSNNEEQKVIFYGEKPQDIEKTEQIVIIGSMKEDVFLASNILLKCPSKYDTEGFDTTEEYSADK